MSAEACCFDGRPFKKLEREFVCVVCARKVCSEHSSDSRISPFTGERGHACRRCLAETIEGTVEAQVALLHRQMQSFGAELKALAAAVQALRQEVSRPPPPPPSRARAPRAAAKAVKPTKSPARKAKSAEPVA